jgi:hypothetical protein
VYAFGSELVVAPIVEPREQSTLLGRARAWLPPGSWTDVFTGTTYAGDRWVDLHRGLDGVPVLLRAGGVLPLAAEDEVDATVNPTSFEVLVAPDASGSFTLVEDREGDPASTCTTRLSWDAESATFRIDAAEGDRTAVPTERHWRVTFLAAPAPGQHVDAQGHDRFSVDVTADAATGASVTLAGTPTVGLDARDAVRQLLERAQVGNPEKLEAWTLLARDTPRADRIAELETVGLPDPLRAALVELLGSVHPAA